MNIKAIREALGYTQERLAREIGVSWATVCRWENGTKPSPLAREKLEKLAKKAKINGEGLD